MTLQDVIKEVPVWVKYNFPDTYDKPVSAALGLAEEVGEVCRAVLKDSEGIRGTHEEWMEELDKEMADVFIKLVHVAHVSGRDLQSAVEKRWFEDISKRDWQKDKIGHGING